MCKFSDLRASVGGSQISTEKAPANPPLVWEQERHWLAPPPRTFVTSGFAVSAAQRELVFHAQLTDNVLTASICECWSSTQQSTLHLLPGLAQHCTHITIASQ